MSVRNGIGGAIVTAWLVVSAWAQAPQNPTVWKFVSGGEARLKLSAGRIEVMPGIEDHIRLSWTTKDPDDMDDVKVKSRVTDKEAEIQVDGPKGFIAKIELPRKTDLWIRMTAGNLTIGEFVGNKDVKLRAGDLEIRCGEEKETYSRVGGSVTSGGLDAPAFAISKGGLWRSFTHRGNGIYQLHAHVTAGQLTIK